ncbi:hypothetical protein GCM10017576_15820 [Microbacterium barkeri]|uniref:Choice-of-anchor A domain-containing protein n=2 Tax=Microbacterium barkeri TaxID=33917 RepID=A0A9W6LWS2_9MICO|nr:collagen-binding domain-containing protein [Microbacterium barkeri]MDR6878162.1 hypothetical protein [Microbacterium barkeri]GLJ61453.1 hypothetical protein GCM10017576_15820 [Microbacterium barkeri]
MGNSPAGASRRLIAAGAISALVAFGGAAVAAPANAAVEYINPFEGSGAFTIYAHRDASLGNGELEGSIAVGGTLSTTRDNYPLIHQAAGQSTYTVPVIDGEPVRLLAGSYVGGAGRG